MYGSDESDEQQPDRVEDIRPRFHKSRVISTGMPLASWVGNQSDGAIVDGQNL